jgi:hypothetical protein
VLGWGGPGIHAVVGDRTYLVKHYFSLNYKLISYICFVFCLNKSSHIQLYHIFTFSFLIKNIFFMYPQSSNKHCSIKILNMTYIIHQYSKGVYLIIIIYKIYIIGFDQIWFHVCLCMVFRSLPVLYLFCFIVFNCLFSCLNFSFTYNLK